MAMILNDEQAALRDSAHGFMKTEAPVAHFRKFRDMNCKDGFSHALWKQFAEMGFTGVLIPEADGGLGMGHVEAGIVLEEIGRNLTPSPFLMTSVAAVEALKGADKALRDRWFPGILSGETVIGQPTSRVWRSAVAMVSSSLAKNNSSSKAHQPTC
jgi:alkylation response protein AidB-like acyl-CoA dehydrogenase